MIRSRTMRGAAFVAGCALLGLAPISASALGISIVNVSSSGGNVAQLADGDVLTIDLALENATAEQIFGLSLGAFGYDVGNDGVIANDHLRFVGGSVASSVFNTTLLPGPIALGGLDNIRTEPTQLGAGTPFNDPRRVQLFDGVSLTAATGDGSIDVGVDGQTVGSGDAHFRISFVAVAGLTGIASNNVTLGFGVSQFNNGAIGANGALLDFSDATYVVNVVPEPGVALLVGLGLAGLAARGRR